MALVSAEQVSFLGAPASADNNVCSAISASQAAAMPASAFSGVKSYCASDLSAACGGLTVDDWNQLSVEQAIAHIPGACVRSLPDDVVLAMSLSPDVAALSNLGFSGFQSHQLGMLFEKHGVAFPNVVSVNQAGSLGRSALQSYARLFRTGGFQPTLTLGDVPHNPQSVNALQVRLGPPPRGCHSDAASHRVDARRYVWHRLFR